MVLKAEVRKQQQHLHNVCDVVHLRLHACHLVHLFQVVVSVGDIGEGRRGGVVESTVLRCRRRGCGGGKEGGSDLAQRAVSVFLATLVNELSVAPDNKTSCCVRKQRPKNEDVGGIKKAVNQK
jgi:hypothetical protein